MALGSRSTKKLAEAGVEIQLLDPANDLPMDEMITVLGSDSEACKKIQQRQTNHRLEVQAQKGNRKKPTTSAEAMEAEGLDLLVECTKSWRTLLKDEKGKVVGSRPEIELAEGEWLEFTPENVRRLYEELPWIKEQIDQAIGDRSNFLQN
jgi:hypothetical protein